MSESTNSEARKGRFLTDTQRDYLRGNHEPPSDNAENQIRYKIRQRTMGALLDLTIASRGLSDTDIDHIFNHVDPDDSESGEYTFEQVQYLDVFQNQLQHILTFLCVGIDATESLYVTTPVKRDRPDTPESAQDGYVHIFDSIPDKEARKEIVEDYGEDYLREYFMQPDIDFDLETMLREAIEQVARQRNERVVSFELETEPLDDIDELYKRFENRERLSPEQINRLRQEKGISGSAIQEYYQER